MTAKSTEKNQIEFHNGFGRCDGSRLCVSAQPFGLAANLQAGLSVSLRHRETRHSHLNIFVRAFRVFRG
jgi:hypothetical protein